MFDTDRALASGLLPGVPWSGFEPSGLLTDLLSSTKVDELDADDALETAAAWERLVAHAQAQQFRALARFADIRTGTELAEFAADEVAPVLHLSRGAAGARLDLATRLCTQLPDTLAALASGTIDLPKARAISEATEVLDAPATVAVQARVLPKAPRQTVGELRAALSRAVLAADPDAADRRHRAARADRRVQLHPHPDGMAALWALLPADDATAAYARLDMLARDMDAEDPRGMDARRADILTDLLLGRDVRGQRQTTVEAQVTLDAATLAGLADNPGELTGYGPIPAEMARDLAAAACRWRAALVDEQTGQLKDLSVAYRPRRLLDLTIRARNTTCCFPGCRQPARSCDLDHTIPHDQDGRTAAGNRARCAAITTGPRPTPAGHCPNPNPGCSSGPAPPAASTTSGPHPAPRSTRPSGHTPDHRRFDRALGATLVGMAAVNSLMVPLGTPAPEFSLPSVGGATVSSADLAGAPALLVMFLSNHCPYVRHIEAQLGAVVADYTDRGLAAVAICSNDSHSYPDDAPAGLAEQARRAGFTFPYLIDETQQVAQAYRAACTPDFFLYDGTGRLAYRGEFDDARPRNDIPVTGAALRSALDRVLAGEPVPEPQHPSMGCDIKWKPGNEPATAAL